VTFVVFFLLKTKQFPITIVVAIAIVKGRDGGLEGGE
jgi:hypothetical protein